MKNLIYGCAILILVSCGSQTNKELMTSNGYTYTHEKNGTKKVGVDDYVYFKMKIVGSDGKVLQEDNDPDNLPSMKVPAPDSEIAKGNPILEIFAKMNVNDKVTMNMPIDSIPNGKNNPQLKDLEYIQYIIDIVDTKSEVDYNADMEAKRLEHEAKAEITRARVTDIEKQIAATISDYKKGTLDIKTTEEGLKYVVHEEGTGKQAASGMKASVHYYGTLMDGTMFDNSFKRGQPFSFAVGQGQVIKGWDLGVPLMKEGGKATLFLPYDLAYGEAGSPPSIPAKSDLVFYVELLEVK
ncbi:MAG: FKBP-type peptidyl-prolyl cis-trans isomerase [Saprospiraceae bacterium]